MRFSTWINLNFPLFIPIYPGAIFPSIVSLVFGSFFTFHICVISHPGFVFLFDELCRIHTLSKTRFASTWRILFSSLILSVGIFGDKFYTLSTETCSCHCFRWMVMKFFFSHNFFLILFCRPALIFFVLPLLLQYQVFCVSIFLVVIVFSMFPFLIGWYFVRIYFSRSSSSFWSEIQPFFNILKALVRKYLTSWIKSSELSPNSYQSFSVAVYIRLILR